MSPSLAVAKRSKYVTLFSVPGKTLEQYMYGGHWASSLCEPLEVELSTYGYMLGFKHKSNGDKKKLKLIPDAIIQLPTCKPHAVEHLSLRFTTCKPHAVEHLSVAKRSVF